MPNKNFMIRWSRHSLCLRESACDLPRSIVCESALVASYRQLSHTLCSPSAYWAIISDVVLTGAGVRRVARWRFLSSALRV